MLLPVLPSLTVVTQNWLLLPRFLFTPFKSPLWNWNQYPMIHCFCSPKHDHPTVTFWIYLFIYLLFPLACQLFCNPGAAGLRNTQFTLQKKAMHLVCIWLGRCRRICILAIVFFFFSTPTEVLFWYCKPCILPFARKKIQYFCLCLASSLLLKTITGKVKKLRWYFNWNHLPDRANPHESLQSFRFTALITKLLIFSFDQPIDNISKYLKDAFHPQPHPVCVVTWIRQFIY